MAVFITGDKEIDAILRDIVDRGVKKAALAAVRKGMRVMAKAQKSALPPQYKGLKTAIGSRVAKAKGKDQTTAKAGFGVGIRGKRRQKMLEKAAKKSAARKGKKRGVGLSVNNAHWAVLGTKQRTTKAGHATGKMPPILLKVIPDGTAASEAEVRAKIVESLKADLAKVKP